MRIVPLTMLSALALAACSPEMPNSAAGVTEREAAGLPPAQAVTATSLDSDSPEAIAAATSAALGVAPQAGGAPLSAMGSGATTSEIVATPAGAAGLSDEQNFAAVSARETIESDAERLAQNRAHYQVIEPAALPPRPDGRGASIVAYALATNNAPGQPLYKRTSLGGKARFERSCAKYGGDDRAQEVFLDSGGPQRDRYGMDPDGDGFACYWDPRPFRAARAAAPAAVPANTQ